MEWVGLVGPVQSWVGLVLTGWTTHKQPCLKDLNKSEKYSVIISWMPSHCQPIPIFIFQSTYLIILFSRRWQFMKKPGVLRSLSRSRNCLDLCFQYIFDVPIVLKLASGVAIRMLYDTQSISPWSELLHTNMLFLIFRFNSFNLPLHIHPASYNKIQYTTN